MAFDRLKLENSKYETWKNRSLVLPYGTYADYLASDEWAQIRRLARGRPHYSRCYVCKRSDLRLEIHHRTYKWIGTEHSMRGLVALCRQHHQRVHDISNLTGKSVRLATRIAKREYERVLI